MTASSRQPQFQPAHNSPSSQGAVAVAPDLSVVIVSYNTRDMTLECLETLFERSDGLDLEVIVVDNASTDGSVEAIRERFPHVQLIASETNLGFGAANNAGMKIAHAPLFLLLNSDAFPREGALRTLVEYAREHPKVGITGPRLLNKDGSLQRSCYHFPTPGRVWLENLWISNALPHTLPWGDYRFWKHDYERSVDMVTGACMLVRREVWEKVGGFDEKFFMYFEEIDWERRIRKAGWDIRFLPAAEVVHLGGASGASDQARIRAVFFDSLDYYQWKHHGLLGLVLLRLAMAIGTGVRAFGWTGATLIPKRRAKARAKAKFTWWLWARQLTYWKFPFRHS